MSADAVCADRAALLLLGPRSVLGKTGAQELQQIHAPSCSLEHLRLDFSRPLHDHRADCGTGKCELRGAKSRVSCPGRSGMPSSPRRAPGRGR